MDKHKQRYQGYTAEWAHGRLLWAKEALDHIEQYGLRPGDRRPYTLATDLPAICYVLGELADEHPTVKRVEWALGMWRLDPEEMCDQLFGQ